MAHPTPSASRQGCRRGFTPPRSDQASSNVKAKIVLGSYPLVERQSDGGEPSSWRLLQDLGRSTSNRWLECNPLRVTLLPDKERLRLTSASGGVARATRTTMLRMTTTLGLGLTISGLEKTSHKEDTKIYKSPMKTAARKMNFPENEDPAPKISAPSNESEEFLFCQVV